MKRIILSLLLLLSFLQVRAGGDKYIKAMESALSILDTATTSQTLIDLANRFERIGQAEKKEWLPWYYASLCYVNYSYSEEDLGKRDQLLDKAEGFLETALEMKMKDFEKSEVQVMQGLIYSGRIMVEPQTRGMVFGPKAGQTFAKAKELNPENPRALFYYGQNLAFTPKQFGGGLDKGVPMMQEAVERFDTFEPASSIHPDWGKEYAVEALKEFENMDEVPWQNEDGGEGEEEAPEEK